MATKETILTMGFKYAFNPCIGIKAKMDQYGAFGASLKLGITPDVAFIFSVASHSHDSWKIRFAVSHDQRES